MAADEGHGIHNSDIPPLQWIALAGAVDTLMVSEGLMALISKGVCPNCARFIIYHACERIMARLMIDGGVRRLAEN